MHTLKLSTDPRGVARVVLARPEIMNAFDETMIAELAETFTTLGRSREVHIVVLEAEGRAFSAGADLRWMQRASRNTPEENLADARRFAAMMETIHRCPKPVIARVQGHAYGGGVGLIAASDIVIASAQCRLAVTEARFGIIPAVIGPYLIAAVGRRQAQRLALTALPIDASEALAIGLVHRVVAPEALDAELELIVTSLCSNGPTAFTEIKSLYAQLPEGQIDAMTSELSARAISRVRATDEAREGFAAFFEKRPARWVRG